MIKKKTGIKYYLYGKEKNGTVEYMIASGHQYIHTNVLTTYDIIYCEVRKHILETIILFRNSERVFSHVSVYIGKFTLNLNNLERLKFDIDVTKPFRLHNLVENVL